MLNAILPRCELVITTQSIHPRAASPEELKVLVEKFDIPVMALAPAENALAKAIELAGQTKGILVTGSIFIAAAAKVIWPQIHKL